MRRVMEYLSTKPHLLNKPVKDIVCISGHKAKFVRDALQELKLSEVAGNLLSAGIRPTN